MAIKCLQFATSPGYDVADYLDVVAVNVASTARTF